MTITSSPSPIAGQRHTLNCFARTEDNVASVPTLKWVSIDNEDITENDQTNSTTSANRSLTIDTLCTSHGGRYTCRARIDIPLGGIFNRSDHATEDVRVQSKLGFIATVVCMPNHKLFVPYQFHLPLCQYLSIPFPTMGQYSH